MQETLYRPHASEGTHFCENRDQDGWLKGSTLDNESNKVHGTLDLEPVVIETDADDGTAALGAIVACAFAAGIALTLVIEHSGAIVSKIKEALHRVHLSRRKREENNPQEDPESQEDNIIILEDYISKMSTEEKEETDSNSEAAAL